MEIKGSIQEHSCEAQHKNQGLTAGVTQLDVRLCHDALKRIVKENLRSRRIWDS